MKLLQFSVKTIIVILGLNYQLKKRCAFKISECNEQGASFVNVLAQCARECEHKNAKYVYFCAEPTISITGKTCNAEEISCIGGCAFIVYKMHANGITWKQRQFQVNCARKTKELSSFDVNTTTDRPNDRSTDRPTNQPTNRIEWQQEGEYGK